MAKGLALFDFDGTITSKDSLLEFIKFTSGKVGFLLVMGLFSPMIFYYVFVKKDSEIAKMKVLSFLFKGKTEEELSRKGSEFAEIIIPNILLPKALDEIETFKTKGDRIIVISASLEIWLKPWTDKMGLELLCTRMEFKDGKFTGKFATPNCNGLEKVNRIKSYLNIEEYKPVYAYGNSSGDKPMLGLADKAFYREFE